MKCFHVTFLFAVVMNLNLELYKNSCNDRIGTEVAHTFISSHDSHPSKFSSNIFYLFEFGNIFSI